MKKIISTSILLGMFMIVSVGSANADVFSSRSRTSIKWIKPCTVVVKNNDGVDIRIKRKTCDAAIEAADKALKAAT